MDAALVLVIDQDDQPDRKRQLSDAQEDMRLSTLQRAMGVAVVTFDAWMLADEQALSKVLARPVQRQPDAEQTRDPKTQCAKLRDETGSSLSLAELYKELAAAIDLSVLAERCPSGFGPFAERVLTMADAIRS